MTETEPESRWPTIRAVLIVVVVTMNLAQGFPVPNIQRRHLEAPIGQRELTRWTARLQGMGFDIDHDELAERALDVSESMSRAHGSLMDPVWPYFHWTQVTQRWSLFPVADPDPWWMHIEGRAEGGEWTLLYRPLDPDATDHAELLEYRRVRGHWNPGTNGPRADHARFVDWLAKRLFADRPDLDEIRVQYQQFHVHLPGQTPDPNVSWHFPEVRRREAE